MPEIIREGGYRIRQHVEAWTARTSLLATGLILPGATPQHDAQWEGLFRVLQFGEWFNAGLERRTNCDESDAVHDATDDKEGGVGQRTAK